MSALTPTEAGVLLPCARCHCRTLCKVLNQAPLAMSFASLESMNSLCLKTP
jgi:hypothetical protein